MGLSFYSRIRSGDTSNSSNINDIYQKFKEGIGGFSIQGVVEDNFNNLIEITRIREILRIFIPVNPDADLITINNFPTVTYFEGENILNLPSGNDDLDDEIGLIRGGSYNNFSVKLPSFGFKSGTSNLQAQIITLSVKGDFSIVSSDNLTLQSSDVDGYNNATSAYNVITYTLTGLSTGSITYTLNGGTSKTLGSIAGNKTIAGNTVITGDIDIIIKQISSTDSNNNADVLARKPDLTQAVFALLGDGIIRSSNRLPFYIES